MADTPATPAGSAAGPPAPISCPLCEHVCEPTATTCPNCGLDLSKALPRTMGTFPLAPGDFENVFRWGTSVLDEGKKITLHIEGFQEPLLAELTLKLVMGRYDRKASVNPDVDLTLYGARQKGVSRRHVALELDEDCVRVLDLGSTNSTFLNGYRLLPHQARILRDGDELTLGRMKVKVNFE